MNLINITSIKIPSNRQRAVFDEGELRELVESIEKHGLLHPIVLRSVDQDFFLVAGERRLRAIQDIHDLGGKFNCGSYPIAPGMVPYTHLGDLTPLEAMEAEFEENVRRTDLSWQERAKATADLMALRNAQADSAGGPLPTVADIAKEVRGSAIGSFQEDTRQEIILSRHLDDPDVAGAKSSREAFKVLKRKEQSRKDAALGESIGRTFSAAAHSLENSDSQHYMEGHLAESFDVILTDPPYGMGADEFGDSGGMAAGSHGYADSKEVLTTILGWFPRQSFRVAKAEAHLYLFCDIDWFSAWKLCLTSVGWNVFRTPLIWHKPDGFRAPWPEHGPQRAYELILYARKGDRKVKRLAKDILTFSAEDNLGHAAQKPVALYQELLSRSCSPGDAVLDPFCGTGPIFPAAHALKCKASGIERDIASYGIAAGRLKLLV
jgi:DNA modification methylase